jgi:hypothetical protein
LGGRQFGLGDGGDVVCAELGFEEHHEALEAFCRGEVGVQVAVGEGDYVGVGVGMGVAVGVFACRA